MSPEDFDHIKMLIAKIKDHQDILKHLVDVIEAMIEHQLTFGANCFEEEIKKLFTMLEPIRGEAKS